MLTERIQSTHCDTAIQKAKDHDRTEEPTRVAVCRVLEAGSLMVRWYLAGNPRIRCRLLERTRSRLLVGIRRWRVLPIGTRISGAEGVEHVLQSQMTLFQ